MLSPLVRVDVWASHEAVEATQRRQRRQRGRQHLAGRRARCGGMTACGHDRRSPPVESQGDGRMRTGTGPETTSWAPLIISKAWQSRFPGRGEKILFRETNASKPICHSGRESTSRLRDGVALDAIVGQQAMMRPSRLSLNAVEDRTALTRLPGKHHHSCSERRDENQRRVA